jgi:hypothetical protein
MSLLAGNQAIMLNNKDTEIDILNQTIKATVEQLQRQKRKTIFVGVIGFIATSLTIFLLK